ncbi:Minor teichoic acid biosynthesis protein GgaB [Planococcus halocryophilus Or1]|uniref:hypothetical protein n=1 Tax=Planococcus halocryophilus TaxID=1215089 RepID=UPI0002B85756|nr:hypothetical protein [Planococcus halocryophilus]EMF47548.1 Minor teichoic acid biosynthesis protein GgaB [Planococcus halocryophilus Or1]
MIGAIEEFIGSKAYLMVEDRASQESLQVPISGEFTVDFNTLDLISLKSKDKTVLDLFVVIENNSQDVIRKEKLDILKRNTRKIIIIAILNN